MILKGTRLRYVFRENIGSILREIKVAFTPIPRSKKWLFLVGCYNSGTTLLAEILSRHPDISGLPTEGHFLTDQFVKDYEVGLPRMWTAREELFRLTENDTGPDPVRVKKEWGMRLNLAKPVLLEKSPSNSAKTRWLNRHFKSAYFLCIIRNGYAVAEGIRRKGGPMHLRDGWPIELCAHQWCRTYEMLESDSCYLKHFMTIKYEDLVSNPINELNRITSFIGVRSFDNFNQEMAFSIHERKEPIKDLNPVSIRRLTPEDIERINYVALETLRRYGYPVINARHEKRHIE